MSGKGWRLTRRGRRVAWGLLLGFLAWGCWVLWQGYEACLAAGHDWAVCAIL